MLTKSLCELKLWQARVITMAVFSVIVVNSNTYRRVIALNPKP